MAGNGGIASLFEGFNTGRGVVRGIRKDYAYGQAAKDAKAVDPRPGLTAAENQLLANRALAQRGADIEFRFGNIDGYSKVLTDAAAAEKAGRSNDLAIATYDADVRAPFLKNDNMVAHTGNLRSQAAVNNETAWLARNTRAERVAAAGLANDQSLEQTRSFRIGNDSIQIALEREEVIHRNQQHLNDIASENFDGKLFSQLTIGQGLKLHSMYDDGRTSTVRQTPQGAEIIGTNENNPDDIIVYARGVDSEAAWLRLRNDIWSGNPIEASTNSTTINQGLVNQNDADVSGRLGVVDGENYVGRFGTNAASGSSSVGAAKANHDSAVDAGVAVPYTPDALESLKQTYKLDSDLAAINLFTALGIEHQKAFMASVTGATGSATPEQGIGLDISFSTPGATGATGATGTTGTTEPSVEDVVRQSASTFSDSDKNSIRPVVEAVSNALGLSSIDQTRLADAAWRQITVESASYDEVADMLLDGTFTGQSLVTNQAGGLKPTRNTPTEGLDSRIGHDITADLLSRIDYNDRTGAVEFHKKLEAEVLESYGLQINSLPGNYMMLSGLIDGQYTKEQYAGSAVLSALNELNAQGDNNQGLLPTPEPASATGQGGLRAGAKGYKGGQATDSPPTDASSTAPPEILRAFEVATGYSRGGTAAASDPIRQREARNKLIQRAELQTAIKGPFQAYPRVYHMHDQVNDMARSLGVVDEKTIRKARIILSDKPYDGNFLNPPKIRGAEWRGAIVDALIEARIVIGG